MANKSKWMVSAKKADFNLIAGECGISPILARLIRNRDVVGVEETRRFLKGTTKDLHDPRMLPDAEKAVDILCQKIEEGGKIRIIGDYDVDGICSSYILVSGLKKCGAAADAVLPERLRDGYGVNERLVREAHEDGATSARKSLSLRKLLMLLRLLSISFLLPMRLWIPRSLRN